MSAALLTIIGWSYGLAGVLYALLALRLASVGDRSSRTHAMLWAVAWTAIWGLSVCAFTFYPASPFLQLGSVADILAYAGWYVFLLLLSPTNSPDRADPKLRVGWLLAAAIAVVAWGLAAHLLNASGMTGVLDPERIAQYDSLAAAVLGLVFVEQVLRNATHESRWAITHLTLGLAAIFAFDVFTFADALLFQRIDPDVWSVRGFVRSLAMMLMLVSLLRVPGGKFTIVVSRQVMFRSAALAMCGMYLLFVAAAGYYVRYFGGQWGRALQVALFVAALLLLLVLVFSGSIRAKLRVTVSKHFFRYRYDYREEWLRFTQALSTQDQHVAMGQQVIRGLANMVESPGGALWLRDVEGGQFLPTATWNMAAGEAEPASGSLAQFLGTRGWVINLEELRSWPERYRELELPEWLSQSGNAWLIVPLTIGNDLTGFVVLATARTAIEVNWEVNDLLKTAARQAASFLGHIQASEALLEARKFEAFNRLSAFVVHDLKNIVSQLSLMLRNAERHHDNPEFRQDMLMTVGHSVDRMKQLMLQLREGTTPLDVLHRVDLAEVAACVKNGKMGQRPQVEIEIKEHVAARGHQDRLERVIGHLVQNAIEATDAAGRVWITVTREGDVGVVEIGDTGHGMTAEFVRERLFKPFQTTKPTGMGIGAYESHQYVRELGGRVVVDSAPNAGTRVRLLLPVFEPGTSEARLREIA